MIERDLNNDITEDKAKERWCPHGRVADPSDGASLSYNRWNENLGPPENDCPCIGSRCMAWRWTRFLDGAGMVGRCGLAG